jgi:lysophospholipid acyltransferase (LPLAT)-like uncharacterized protein
MVPVVPINFSAPLRLSLFWRWDKYIIPMPFSEVRVNVGKAIMPGNQLVDLRKELNDLGH